MELSINLNTKLSPEQLKVGPEVPDVWEEHTYVETVITITARVKCFESSQHTAHSAYYCRLSTQNKQQNVQWTERVFNGAQNKQCSKRSESFGPAEVPNVFTLNKFVRPSIPLLSNMAFIGRNNESIPFWASYGGYYEYPDNENPKN